MARARIPRLTLAYVRRFARVGLAPPSPLVRVAYSHTEAVKLIFFSRDSSKRLEAERLTDRCILDEKVDGISMFEADSMNRFDVGHALGIVAVTINRKDYDASKRDQYSQKIRRATEQGGEKITGEFETSKVVSFVFAPTDLKGFKATFTPMQNLEFPPADDRHFDVTVASKPEFIDSFLTALSLGTVLSAALEKFDVRAMAAIALAHVRGRMSPESIWPATKWYDGKTLSATEQLERLRYLSGECGLMATPRIPKT